VRLSQARCTHRLPRNGFAAAPAALFAALTLLLAAPSDAASHTAHSAVTTPHARVPAEKRPFGAACRTVVDGSHVTAYCHNPYPESDHVGLHIECDRWWDLDADGTRVEAGPAQNVRLTGRCWKEVRSAWVSHQK
jgi:hypothetical protein